MKKTRKIWGICISLLILFSIIIMQSVAYMNSTNETMYFAVEELRYRNEPNMGYAIGNPSSGSDSSTAAKIWNIVKRSSADSSDIIEGHYYCLKADAGFSDITANVKYNVFYDLKTEKEQIMAQNSIMKSMIDGDITLDDGTTVGKYECILAVLDMLYLPGSSSESYKTSLLNDVLEYAETQAAYNAYIELMEQYPLTDDDITAIQQAVIWYFTNYGEKNGKFDKTNSTGWINYKLENTDYTTLSGYKQYETGEGQARSYQGEAFYNYMIKEAKGNATKYTNGTVNQASPVNITTESLNYEETETNYIVGPIRIDERADNTLSYTIQCSLLNENIEISDYTILNSQKKKVATGTTIKDLVGQDFYLSFTKPETSIADMFAYGLGDVNYDGAINSSDIDIIQNVINGTTTLNSEEEKRADINLDGEVNSSDLEIVNRYVQCGGKANIDVNFKVDYEVTETMVAASTENSDEQPISISEKQTLTSEAGLTTTVEHKTFDLSLRKYITSVDGVELTGESSRVPSVVEDSLDAATTATYNHKKDPVEVTTGSKVVYKMTIYNEGEKAGRATKIIDQLPTGLKFAQILNGNFTGSYNTTNNQLTLTRKSENTDNLAAYTAGNMNSETIEIECEVTQTAQTSDKVLTNVAWIVEEIDAESDETITNQVWSDRDSEPATVPDVDKDNMENYTGNNNKEDLTDSNNYYKGEQDDDDFEKIVIKAATSVVVNKVWEDNNNQDGIRATEVEVVLVKNGTDTTTTAKLNAENNWTYTFENLAKKENGANITYSVKEKSSIAGYTSVVTTNSENNYTITNTHTPEVTNVVVNKVWEDNNNQDGIRATEVEVVLVKNGAETETTAKLNAENNWTYTFENLAKKENGTDVEYTVKEKSAISGYTGTVTKNSDNNYTITNTHTPGITSVIVNKVWEDENNEDGIRPTEIEVVLVKNGTETTTAKLNIENNWTYTFDNLPLKENGVDITYTVKENTTVEGYTTVITENSKNNYTITNTHEVEREFDLSLRKYITSVDGVELTGELSRVPSVAKESIETGTTATYKHKKDPVEVTTGSKVIYKITIFNEGEKEGRATKVVDQLPTGLKFVKVVSGNFVLDSYDESDNRLNLKRVDGNTANLPAYAEENISAETIEIECEVTMLAGATDKVLTNVAWISEEVDGVTNEVITNQENKDRDSEPATTPDVNKDNMENYKGKDNKEDLTDSNNYYKGEQDDDDFEKIIIRKAEGVYNLQVIKTDKEDTSKTLSGAEFKVTLADGSSKTLTTNEQGIISINGINITEEGTETIIIEETKAPIDYERIIESITLQVTKAIVDGNYQVTKATIVEGSNEVSTTLENNIIEVVVQNEEIQKPIDLKLIKRIVAVNNQNVGERIENLDVSKLNTLDENGNRITTGEYTLNKEPVAVKKGDIVTYTFRIYNEGMIDGYATEITEDVPEGLEFLWSEKEEEDLQDDTTLTEEEKEAIEFNQKYLWGNFKYDESGEKIVQISSNYLSKENETTVGGNLIPAFGENDGSKTEANISYKEISVKFKVVAENLTESIIKNEAAITEDNDEEGNEVDDRDSDTEDWVKYEDDEDYDNIILQEFDLSLRKFIVAVSADEKIEETEYLKNEDGFYTRAPVVETSKLNTEDEDANTITTATYNHTKEPVLVQPNGIILYMLRVYNEGEIDGYAEEIKDHLPEYLEFVDGEFNKEYGWEVSEDGRTVTTNYLEDSKIAKAEKDDDGTYVLTYKEVPIMCKVVEEAKPSENITNIADITKYLDEDKEPIEDRDSKEENVELPEDEDLPGYKEDEKGSYVPGQEDDDDFEKVIVKTFDLSLRKWVTQAIVIENGEQTATNTGHKPYDDPEQVVKVELHRKKINQVEVKFRYSIRVTNEGEIAGYAKEVTDYIPQGLKFVAEDNPGWTDEGNNVISTKLLENTLLQPGEYAEVEVILTWIKEQDNMGVMTNTAEISEDYNEYGVPDKDSTPDNQEKGEDDIDDAPVMLSIGTGQIRIYFALGFTILITIAGGIVLIKKYVI